MTDLPRIDPERFPHPGDTVAVRVRPAAERALRSGHPWLFEDKVVSLSRPAEAGDVAVVFDAKGRFLAAGLYDPESAIRVRAMVHGSSATIGEELFRDRIARALGLRGQVASRETTAFRVLNGANDGTPGLVADLYDRTLVLQLFTVGWLPHLRSLLPAFQALLAPERVLLLLAGRVAASERCPPEMAGGGVLYGTAPDGGVPFLETGLRFEAHPFQGHKTGFYLDQRANRRTLADHAEGARVLNVFSYTGGFSLYAARAGAREVVSVDMARPALAQAERHFELNAADPGVAACQHRTMCGDAFQVMEELGGGGERFDVVVVDPPSFARSEAQRRRALGAYGKLTGLALRLLGQGGLLVQASCSSRVGADEFFREVGKAARSAGRTLEELERTGHPPDHPVTFPEGAYLKCLWARVG